MSFAERLSSIMKERGFNQKSLALACDFGETAIRDLIKGTAKEPLVSRAYRIAKELDVRIEDLLGLPYLADAGELRVPDEYANENELTPLTSRVIDGVTQIPEYDIKLAAGAGSLVDEERIRDHWLVPTRFITEELRRSPGSLRVVEVVGDSMLPKLQSGDRIIVDHSDTNPTPPGIFALWDGYGLVVKNVQRVHGSDPQKAMLISENPIYPPYEVLLDEITVIGRVVWCGRKM